MKKILFVIDAQRDFIEEPLGTKDSFLVAARIEEMLRKTDRGWSKVIATMDSHTKGSALTIEADTFPPHCLVGSEGAALFGDIPKYVDRIITKDTFSPDPPELCTYLNLITAHDEGTEFFICGFCTDICVISCALMIRSQFPRIRITVLEDLCAGTTPEKHKAALAVMDSCLIEVKSLEQAQVIV